LRLSANRQYYQKQSQKRGRNLNYCRHARVHLSALNTPALPVPDSCALATAPKTSAFKIPLQVARLRISPLPVRLRNYMRKISELPLSFLALVLGLAMESNGVSRMLVIASYSVIKQH